MVVEGAQIDFGAGSITCEKSAGGELASGVGGGRERAPSGVIHLAFITMEETLTKQGQWCFGKR